MLCPVIGLLNLGYTYVVGMEDEMGRRIIPHEHVNTVFDLDLDRLYASGIRFVMIDVDNTLVPTGASDIPEEIHRWMERAKALFGVCLFSNSKKKRILYLAGVFGVPGVYFSLKPTGFGYRRAAGKLGARTPGEVAIIGDQLYTDVLLGRRMGCYTVLVEPCSEVDHFWTKILRIFEGKAKNPDRRG